MAQESEKPLILIVDPIMHDISALALRKCGFRCAHTGSMTEALELAWQEPPDLVMTNLVLLPGDGLELCRQMRNDSRLSAIPVIMLTGHDGVNEAAHEAGVDLFLRMPVSPPDLIEKMKTLLENYAAYKAAARAGDAGEVPKRDSEL